VVANPSAGLVLWFVPEKEIIVVHSTDEAIERYRYLLAHDAERRKMGEAARQRVLKEHTMRHRAQQLVEIVRRYL
jgi:spore maturation protein CgeB